MSLKQKLENNLDNHLLFQVPNLVQALWEYLPVFDYRNIKHWSSK